MKQKILVTGGTGFLGKRLVERLLTTGEYIVLILSRGNHENKGNLKYLKADLTNKTAIQEARELTEDVDAILHLAALIPKSSINQESMIESMEQNFLSTINLLEMVNPDLQVFIYCSTIDVYGLPKYLPINEDHPTHPLSYYGASKLASELFLTVALRRLKVPFTILRLTQLYGPGEPIVKVIPQFISKVIRGERPIVYGDGRDLRDYMYVDDVVNAILAVMYTKKTGVFNISSNKGYKIKEVLDIILKVSGRDLKPIYYPRKKAFIRYTLDNEKAKKHLSWEPTVNLEAGLLLEYREMASQLGA